MKLRPSLMRSGPLQSRLFVRQQADNCLSFCEFSLLCPEVVLCVSLSSVGYKVTTFSPCSTAYIDFCFHNDS